MAQATPASSKEKKPPFKNNAGVGRKKGAGSGLNDLFLAVFGVGFLLSLSMNVLHMMGSFDTDGNDVLSLKNGRKRMAKVHDGSALQKAMSDFKSLGKKKKLEKGEAAKAAVPAKVTTSMHEHEHEANDVGEEHNTHDLPPEMKLGERSDDDNDGGLMELATLDCSAFGGPSKEAAAEMVYWQEIPSDSLYVSPFFKTGQQQASHTKYLTFEPDGGGWYV
ncbi:MAG: hypothetical protein SGARI_006449 [Bacillariaceae sp.]